LIAVDNSNGWSTSHAIFTSTSIVSEAAMAMMICWQTATSVIPADWVRCHHQRQQTVQVAVVAARSVSGFLAYYLRW